MTQSHVEQESLLDRTGRVVRETGATGFLLRGLTRTLLSLSSALERAALGLLAKVPTRLLTSSADRARLGRNVELAGLHRGGRCFILGNGPSLLEEDLSLLRNEIVITVNQGHRVARRNGLQPHYHAVVDALYLRPEHESLLEQWREFQTDTGAVLLLSVDIADRMVALGLGCRHYAVKQFLISTYFDRHGTLPPIEFDKVQPGYTSVIHFAITAALYMGFESIYLLGCDMDFFLDPKAPLAHSYDAELPSQPVPTAGESFNLDQVGLLEWALVEYRAFQNLGRLAARCGSRVVNAGRGGCLNVFQRISLAAALAAEARR